MDLDMKPAFLIAWMSLACVPPTATSAGVVRGTLHVPAAKTDTPAMNAYPGQANSMAMCPPVTHGLVTDAVVYVETVPARVESTLAAMPAATPKLAQKGQTFVPRVVAVAAGSAVDFPNMDPIYHNVFSLSPARRFDLGKYPQGSSRRVEFRKPGLVNVFCEIHSDMAAYVLVLPNHAFTRPTTAGDFRLPDLPAGSYKLHVWHPDLGDQVMNLDVPESGDVLQALSY